MDVTDRIGCVLTAAGAFFRVWAPHAAAVSVAVQDGQEWVGGPGVTHALKRAADDYWSATVPGVARRAALPVPDHSPTAASSSSGSTRRRATSSAPS